jgi:hypothetical protein
LILDVLDDEFGDSGVFFVWDYGRLSHCRRLSWWRKRARSETRVFVYVRAKLDWFT